MEGLGVSVLHGRVRCIVVVLVFHDLLTKFDCRAAKSDLLGGPLYYFVAVVYVSRVHYSAFIV